MTTFFYCVGILFEVLKIEGGGVGSIKNYLWGSILHHHNCGAWVSDANHSDLGARVFTREKLGKGEDIFIPSLYIINFNRKEYTYVSL